jgi:hypothetical protein
VRKKDPMLKEIHEIRKKIWDENNRDSHTLIENKKRGKWVYLRMWI